MKTILTLNMKNKGLKYNLLFAILFFFTTIQLFGQTVSVTQAQNVANQFLKIKNISNWDLQSVFSSEYKNKKGEETPLFYVLENKSGMGFVLVSADLRVHPILGYSNESHFQMDSLPPDLARLLELYKDEIQYIISTIPPEKSNQNIFWNEIEKGTFSSTKATVQPLLTTNWSQRPNYNAKTPVPSGANSTPVGCVATAMTQIMKFHNFPAYGCGTKSYTTFDYGTLAANFGSTRYDWSSMPNSLNSSSPATQINAVSQLMYHAGVAVSMDYTPTGSSAFVSAIPSAFVNYFNYSSNISQKNRSSYTVQQWNQFVINDLVAGRPVLHSGYCPNPAAGHAFVIDGCDELANFHVNWGWSGSHNGYFQLSNLNPGSYAFNQSQTVIVNIQPIASLNQLTLSASMNTPSSVSQSSPFSFTIPIKNTNSSSFSGKVKVELMDLEGNAVTSLYTSGTINLASGAQTTLNVSNCQITAYPGNFKIVAYASIGSSNKWIQLLPGSYTNPKSIKVKEILHPLKISANSYSSTQYVLRNTNTSFNLSVRNTSSTLVAGTLRAVLVNLQGSILSTLTTNSSFSLTGNNSTDFSINGNFNVSKGTYYILLQYKSTNGVYQTLGGSTSSVMPTIKLIVKENRPSNLPSVNEHLMDGYISTSVLHQLTFEKENKQIVYYNAPSSGWYKLNVFDKFSAQFWDASLADVFVEIKSIEGEILASSDHNFEYWMNEGEMYVIAFSKATRLDEKDNFMFKIDLKSTSDSIEEGTNNAVDSLEVYPTIFSDRIYIQTNNESSIREIVLLNQMGQIIRNYNWDTFQTTTDFGNLEVGNYFIQIISREKVVLRKVIKV